MSSSPSGDDPTNQVAFQLRMSLHHAFAPSYPKARSSAEGGDPSARGVLIVRRLRRDLRRQFGYPPPLCNSHSLVQATGGVGTVLIWYLILIRYKCNATT